MYFPFALFSFHFFIFPLTLPFVELKLPFFFYFFTFLIGQVPQGKNNPRISPPQNLSDNKHKSTASSGSPLRSAGKYCINYQVFPCTSSYFAVLIMVKARLARSETIFPAATSSSVNTDMHSEPSIRFRSYCTKILPSGCWKPSG